MRCLKLILFDYPSQSHRRPSTLPGTKFGDLDLCWEVRLVYAIRTQTSKTEPKIESWPWVGLRHIGSFQERGKRKSHIQVQLLKNWNWSNRAQRGSIDNIVAHNITYEWKGFLILQPTNILPSLPLRMIFHNMLLVPRILIVSRVIYYTYSTVGGTIHFGRMRFAQYSLGIILLSLCLCKCISFPPQIL